MKKATKKLMVTFLAALLFLQAAAYGQKVEASDGDSFVLRFSTSATGDSITVKAMEAFKDAIEESTDGQIQIEIYHSSSLFAQDAEMEAIMTGNLDMATGGPMWLSGYVPRLSMLSAAYIYESVEHQDKVMNGEIGKELFAEVSETTGILPLCCWYGGARQLSLRYDSPEIHTPQDMNGVVLRMPNSEDWLFLGEALGASPTPLAVGEIYTALSTGTIDAQDNPLPIVESSKCYEVTKQIVLTRHLLDSVWPCISQKKWDELGPELQEKMVEALQVGTEYAMNENLKAEESLVEFFEGEGIKIVEPDLDAFMEYAQDKYLNSDKSADWDMDLYQKIKEAA